MGKQNFIVINGKRYDALTGQLVATDQHSKQPEVITEEIVSPGTIQATTGKAVDGFVRGSKNSRTAHNARQVRHMQKQPQRSQTLMRGIVTKPSPKTGTKKASVHGILKPKLGISPRRAAVAKEVVKSPQIQKYGHNDVRSSVVRRNSSRPVQPEPPHHAAGVPAQAKEHQSSHSNHDRPRHKNSAAAKQKLIESALASARSHEEPVIFVPRKAKTSRTHKFLRRLGISKRAAAFSSGVLAIVLLTGFYALHNVPNLSMRLAASRAGFDARLPGYKPAGFSFKGPIGYQSGMVTVAFRSNSDSREYKLIQNDTNWNSDALLANFVVDGGKDYQTYLDRGRTLYIYDGSNATWIDDGIWYRVEGNSGMTTDQLIRIASSI